MAQHRLDISELDFENIKGSLKRFLSNQNEFKDYDFEGSSISILFLNSFILSSVKFIISLR